mgnify:CR=1 FL=1
MRARLARCLGVLSLRLGSARCTPWARSATTTPTTSRKSAGRAQVRYTARDLLETDSIFHACLARARSSDGQGRARGGQRLRDETDRRRRTEQTHRGSFSSSLAQFAYFANIWLCSFYPQRLNAKLPAQIRIVSVFPCLGGFDSKVSCSSRSYEYLVPSFGLVDHAKLARHSSAVGGGDSKTPPHASSSSSSSRDSHGALVSSDPRSAALAAFNA